MPAETTTATAVAPAPPVRDDLASLEAGLDALETDRRARQPRWRQVLGRVGPPVVALVLVVAVWQLVAWSGVKSRYAFPWPIDVWDALWDSAVTGRLQDAVWGSVSRAVFGFAASVAIGTPIGLLVARVRPVRTALKPVLSGLQSLPSVAWVPVAIIWFGLTPATIYFVVLMGAVPSIANGTVAGIDQVPPLFQRVGRVLGAQGLRLARHVLLPAALPGYLAGLRQGWAFAWRSLMAAELIAVSPKLGSGLGQELEQGRLLFDMPLMLGMIVCILAVGVAIELLFFAPVERRILRRRGLLLDA